VASVYSHQVFIYFCLAEFIAHTHYFLSSAPEEDYISVHIRIVGDFTSALAKAVGCDFDSKDSKDPGGKVVGMDSNPTINCVLPCVMVDVTDWTLWKCE
jgi:hypothetical protein